MPSEGWIQEGVDKTGGVNPVLYREETDALEGGINNIILQL